MYPGDYLMYRKQKLNVCSWNVRGIYKKTEKYNKLEDNDFTEQLKNYDIIGLVETHCGPDDQIHLDGYYSFQLNRPKLKSAKKYSGGIALLIKLQIKSGIKILEHRNSDYIWIKMSKIFFGLEQDLYMCLTYIPPPESNYLKRMGEETLEYISKDIQKYQKGGQVIIMGDMNAHTGMELDMINDDDDKYQLHDLEYQLDSQNIPQRNNVDSKIDARGKDLIDLCVSAKLRILNGRKFGDLLGNFTCHKYNGSSVVDYMIVDESLFHTINFFQVHKFLNDLSDHCKISCAINILVNNSKITEGDQIKMNPVEKGYKWSKNSAFLFQTALTNPEIKDSIHSFLANKYICQ